MFFKTIDMCEITSLVCFKTMNPMHEKEFKFCLITSSLLFYIKPQLPLTHTCKVFSPNFLEL